MKTLIQKVCVNCGEKFTPSRSNQKFCDTDCKSQFNNVKIKKRYHENKPTSEIMQIVNSIIKKNYTILKKYVGKNVLFSDIEKQGFRYGFLTGIVPAETVKDKTIFICYDVCYYFISQTNIVISPYSYDNE